jgi:hypothetical protein
MFSPRGSKAAKAAFTSRTDKHRTSLRGSGTGNAVTRGNLFDLKNI